LAVIAALSPLLGLLGTMIGMIEAFELVAIYGDEGGASMLAGSIAKALITTAAGLIIAIPAIAAYNYFKHRVNKLTMKLENDVESILDKIS
jgi:biopolymer transport protein ExbB